MTKLWSYDKGPPSFTLSMRGGRHPLPVLVTRLLVWAVILVVIDGFRPLCGLGRGVSSMMSAPRRDWCDTRRDWRCPSESCRVPSPRLSDIYQRAPSLTSTALSATVGRAVYIDNYSGRGVAKAKMLGLSVMDFVLDPRIFNRVVFGILLIGASSASLYKIILRRVFGVNTFTELLAKVKGIAFQKEIEDVDVFECENCRHQIRPAQERARSVFSKITFRCPRCGSKAESFFNIDNMKDPRAVNRKKRLELNRQKRMDERAAEEEVPSDVQENDKR